MWCCRALINLTLCLVLNLAIFYLELAEQLSRTLQGKDTTLKEAITAANLAKNHYTRLRTEAEFEKFYQCREKFWRAGTTTIQKLTMELLLVALNVQRITIECNTMKLATKLKRN